MSKKNFQAKNWFASHTSKTRTSSYSASNQARDLMSPNQLDSIPDKIKQALMPFMPKEEQGDSEGFKKYFIPGWTGEALLSKEVKDFNAIIDQVHLDCMQLFKNQKSFSRRIKIGIYNEFLTYAEFMTLNCSEIDQYSDFWNAISDEHSIYKNDIDKFITIYCYRVAVLYLLKTRFISVLNAETQHIFDSKQVYYPTAYLSDIFKKGSKNELNSSILEPNIYSWYRPSLDLKPALEKFYYCSQSLCITDIIKNISLKSQDIIGKKSLYSHALSHKNFGFFINSLLLNFPLWKNTLDNSLNLNTFYDKKLEIISCKFVGDYLESLALSHWLAQDHNSDIKWEQILCPDFRKNDFENGDFLKFTNEIQFLTFLAQIANSQDSNPVGFISSITNGHKNNLLNTTHHAQTNLLKDEAVADLTYDRIILNLNEFPKNNSQHFMINRILEESMQLKDEGLIFVMSTRKLFIASQKNKIENLLNKLKVEAIITLEDVQGKGEVGSYIYILSNRKNIRLNSQKENVFHFRFSTQLNSFSEYSNLTRLLQSFFINNLAEIPPLYHKALNNTKMEFFQDAIVEGRLIHSTSKDSSKITHPLFFKNLMRSCLPLEAYFDIQQINFEKSSHSDSPLFEFSGSIEDQQADHVIIIDKRSKSSTKLEIIPTSVLELKSYEYGFASCSYFYITPKLSPLSINAIHDFYQTSIGKQIVELTFSTENKKIKANLTQLLLPRFYADSPELPEHLNKGISFLDISSENLLNMHPSVIDENFKNIQIILNDLAIKFPMRITHSISNLKRNLEDCLNRLGDDVSSKNLNFNNPILKSPLVLSKTYPIYPENPDVYIEFNNENSLQLIHSPFSHFKQKKKEINGIDNHVLELYYDETLVLSFYSDEEMLSFIAFILKNLNKVPMAQILQGITVPRLEDLKSIINSYNSMHRTLHTVSEQLPQILDKIVNLKISR